MAKKINWNDKQVLETAAHGCTSYSGVLKNLGLSGVSTNIKTLKKYIGVHGIDTSHFGSKNIGTIPIPTETVPTVEPYVVVKSSKFDPTRGVQVEMDWNPEFVSYLRKNGFTGASEEDVVSKWFAMLSRDVATDMGGDDNEFA